MTTEKEVHVFDYMSQIDDKLVDLADNEYTGSIIFKINFFKGGVTNLNMITEKSIKL